MKGIVFTEFLEMVESKFGLETLDNIIESSDLPSEGMYTSVGTYDFNEMLTLITKLAEVTKIPIGELIYNFGLYLFDGLRGAHPEVIQSYSNPLSLLYSIEDHIHVHVKKLYPDAELPTFKVLDKTDTTITMIYVSSRGLYRLAHGLMESAFGFFNESAEISYEVLNDEGTEVKFLIRQHG